MKERPYTCDRCARTYERPLRFAACWVCRLRDSKRAALVNVRAVHARLRALRVHHHAGDRLPAYLAFKEPLVQAHAARVERELRELAERDAAAQEALRQGLPQCPPRPLGEEVLVR